MIDIRDFTGAQSTSPTLVGEAINRALVEAASTWSTPSDWKGDLLPDNPRAVYIPAGMGVVKVDHPVVVASRCKLFGETRNASKIVQVDPNLPLIEIVGAPGNLQNYAVDVEICNLGLQSNGTGPVITYRNTPANERTVVTFNLHDLHLAGKYLMIFDSDDDEVYTQHARIERVFCSGNCERILRMGGNNIFVRGLEKGPGTGQSDEPYIHIKGHRDGQTGVVNRNYNILLDEVLIQQQASPNKSAIKLERVEGVQISNSWIELTGIKDHLHMVQAENVRVVNTNFNTNVASSVKLEQNSSLSMDRHINGGLGTFDVDQTSAVHIDTFTPYAGSRVAGKRGVTVGKAFATIIYRANPVSKYSPDVTAELFDSVLPDQHFANGLGAWAWLPNTQPTPITSFQPSPFLKSQMLCAEWTDTASGLIVLRQQVQITDDMVGLTSTVTIRGRVQGSVSQRLLPQFFGAAIPMNSGAVMIEGGTGWQVSTLRAPIIQAGWHNVGVGFSSPEPGVVYEIAEIAFKID
jgi:hypothetical protein